MPAVLLDLPNEVLDGIAALLHGAEVKSFRASCRRLCFVTSRYLFPTLFLSCHNLDLDVFRLAAANPAILSGVRELVVDDTTISPSLMTRDVFHAMSRSPELWRLRKTPYFSTDDWDEEGRVWEAEADEVFFNLVKYTYEGHETNRVEQNDVQALRSALAGMTSLRTLVLTNRTADDTPQSGAQSESNSSPVVKLWRAVGESRRERPPFPPRVDWWAPLEDDQFEGDEVLEPGYLVDSLSEFLAVNGSGHHHNIQELSDEEDIPDNETTQPDSDDDTARSDDGSETQLALAPIPTPNDNQPLELPRIPLSARALRREARGLYVITEVLRNQMVQSRLKEFRVDVSHDTLADVQTPGLSLRLFDFLAPPFVSRLSIALSTTFVTRFSLVLSNGRESQAGQDILDQGQVGAVLAAMPRLQHLMLEAHGMGVIGAIPPNLTFRDLLTAEFACGLVSRQEIRQFIRQHRRTLEEFRMLFCSLDDPEGGDPNWSDAVQDIVNMQSTGRANLRTASIISGYTSLPFTGCGRSKTLTRPRPTEPVHSWTLGVDEDVVDCPTEDLGHVALPAIQP